MNMSSNLVLLGTVVIFSFSGLPAARNTYRTVIGGLSVVCWFAAAEWFARFATATDSWVDRWPWVLAIPGWVLGCGAILLLAEFLTLRRFHARRKWFYAGGNCSLRLRGGRPA